MKDLAARINQGLADAQSLSDLERANPRTLRDYCYRDGCPTDWTRKDITEKDRTKGLVTYRCVSCDNKGIYTLKRLEAKE